MSRTTNSSFGFLNPLLNKSTHTLIPNPIAFPYKSALILLPKISPLESLYKLPSIINPIKPLSFSCLPSHQPSKPLTGTTISKAMISLK